MQTALVVAAAPLIWAGTDWLVTGDPLHSLHGTAALAEEADRRRGIEDVPFWTAQYFGFVLREPLVLGVPIGLGFAWIYARSAPGCRSPSWWPWSPCSPSARSSACR